MLSPRSISIFVLLVLGVLFAAANLWFAAARSTIPLNLRGTVTQKLCLIEKTPGVDDVYIITLDSQRHIQVDRPIFDAVEVNQSVRKQAWKQTIEIDGQVVALSWSPDFRGMLWLMPLTIMVCAVVGRLTLSRAIQESVNGFDATVPSSQAS